MREAFWNAARWYDENAANHVNHEIYPNQYWPTVKQAGVAVIGPSTDPELHRSQPGDPELAEGQVAEEVGQRAIDLALGKPA